MNLKQPYPQETIKLRARPLRPIADDVQTAEFLSRLSHELGNSLTVLSLGVGLLSLESAAPNAVSATLASLTSATERLERMMRQLHAVTELQSNGVLTLAREPTDLAALVAKTLAESELRLDLQRIAVSHQGPCCGRLDVDRLRQLVEVVVANALDHGTPQKPVTVHIEGSTTALTMTVHNLGAPMTATHRAQLFGPNAKRQRPQLSRALGFGLFVSHAIATAHGGTLSVDSDTSGTTFTLTLPHSHSMVPGGFDVTS